jgi:hypothetical protein
LLDELKSATDELAGLLEEQHELEYDALVERCRLKVEEARRDLVCHKAEHGC